MPANAQSYYLVGIKGVAMTALAQVLIDAGHRVRGSDLGESFVTEPILRRLEITVDDFAVTIPAAVDQVVYTAAHQAGLHPQVLAAIARGIPACSHAEALAEWFNQKKGLAVCGVGGKSTISAMISWILEKAGHHPSYAVGVGEIIGLRRTGQWSEAGTTFVAEADEYVTDPVAVQRAEQLIARFQYLKPAITVASTISFDHPDVYKNEAHTRQVFIDWFRQLPATGTLISSDENRAWLEKAVANVPIIWYGQSSMSDLVLTATPLVKRHKGEVKSVATITAHGTAFEVSLGVPGSYNMLNALAAIAATHQLGLPIQTSIDQLAAFSSTKRRFEYRGKVQGINCYDDYAHHPREIAVVLEAARQWFGHKRIVVAFQPHTFSRTKALFDDFVAALGEAPELLLLDIFGSARETADPSISSDSLCVALLKHKPRLKVRNLHTIDALAHYVESELDPDDVFLTLGAGDIYKVHDLLQAKL